MEIRYVDVKGKMIKLACFEDEERQDLWLPKAVLKGVDFNNLRGASLVNTEVKDVTSEQGYVFHNLIKGVIERDGDVLVEIDRTDRMGQKNTRGNNRNQEQNQSNQEQGRSRGQSKRGYVKLNSVSEKNNSFLVEGTHIKGEEKNDVKFYISKKMLGNNSLDDKIIVAPEFSEIQKNSTTFTVLVSGILRDRDGNKVELTMPQQHKNSHRR